MKLSRICNLLVITIFVMALSGCSSYRVVTDYDKESPFSSYKAFTICTDALNADGTTQPLYDNPINRSRIKEAIQLEMRERGYVEDELTARLQVGFQIVFNNREVTIRQCTNRRRFPYWANCWFETYDYTEGTLIIYVTDLQDERVIWQGIAKGALSTQSPNMEKLIPKIVGKIFRQYPEWEADAPREGEVGRL